MTTFVDSAKRLVATAAKIAKLQSATLEASVLDEASASLVQTGYDNWNEGTDLYTLMLEVPIPMYAKLEEEREKLEESIRHRLTLLIRTEAGNSITDVVITPVLLDDARPGDAEEITDSSGGEVVPEFWQPGYFRLFLSHISANKADAHLLKESLASYQIAAFVAHDDIEPTREWQTEIESALRTMDALVAIISPGFIESRWCDQEVGFAFGRRKLVVPLQLGEDPHGFLGKVQGLQANGLEVAVVAEALFDILIQNDFTSHRITESLVERLVISGSWASSKRTMSMLEKSPRLNENQMARVISAIDENNQVGDAFGVPERIRTLVSRPGMG